MNILPLLFLLVIVFPSIVKPISKAADDHDCPVQRCGHDGPDIKFPFRLQHYPRHCGHPEFEVSCSSFSNKTMMKLSSSSGFFLIQTIDYERQQFRVYDEDDCLPRRLPNFTLSFSLFKPANVIKDCCSIYNYEQNLMYMTLLNCTQAQDLMHSFPISCLSVPGHYQILAVNGDFTLNELPVGSECYTLSEFFLPVQKTLEDPCGCELDNRLFLEWNPSDFPECQNCSGRCYINYSSNQVLKCYPPIPSPRSIPSLIPSPIQKHKGLSTRFIVMGVSVCGFVVLSTTAVAIFYHLKQSIKRKEEKENQRKIEKFLDDHKSHVPTRYSYADIKKMTNGFKKKLGEGGFGSVFSGKLPTNGVPVAIKVLKDSEGNGDDFVNEVGTIGRIHHVNVVRLLGFSAEGGKRALIYELMPNSSLGKFITSRGSNKSSSSFNWEKLCNIITGIAKGIEYLHQGCDQRILHFDIKPHNILLDHAFNPKISDFGMAKLCSKEDSVISMTAARGTTGYIAPEVFNGNFGTVSYKSDVYSFGMLVLEVIGAMKETAVTSSDNEVYFPELIYECLIQGEELDLELADDGDAQIAKRLAIVALWCIQWYPVSRPSMKAVVRMLEGPSESLIMPPNPFASTTQMEQTTTPSS
ncbi:putative glycerophosphodiester phosphodiesterase, protein kinase RLK-Pelle-LRK10L-2 family [Rosa chinensis]|uniref:Putative glycerophosphodiester phosphodiesterase, protein kinase RLK-Pelle-LRK10L-2 family n=1 Tax=Rosa chinensis TaxID=74649 RepID=A0A2P6R5G5_ROSCH|nr:rust resistance kinase Lr10 [Rosa chinensis]PRQ41675.1 putative glycerophosphodiester phosphodiesterase, protein kinase RLK-Pelle-LRK10L-2 family [Rosa chinensis]